MMWCISGIPGSGKTTICKLLDGNGIKCLSALDIPGAEKCLDDDEVDTDCLKSIISREGSVSAVESHFSHLLGCSSVIILQRSEEGVAGELRGRGYSEDKIEENLDALRADVIYSEALQALPSGRIHRITVEEGGLHEAFLKCRDLILSSKNKD